MGMNQHDFHDMGMDQHDFHDMGMNQHDFHDMGLGQPIDKSDWVDPFNMGDLEDRVQSF